MNGDDERDYEEEAYNQREFLEHARDAGVEPCAWFALCTNTATTTRTHPVLGEVPICTRCDEKIARLAGASS